MYSMNLLKRDKLNQNFNDLIVLNKFYLIQPNKYLKSFLEKNCVW